MLKVSVLKMPAWLICEAFIWFQTLARENDLCTVRIAECTLQDHQLVNMCLNQLLPDGMPYCLCQSILSIDSHKTGHLNISKLGLASYAASSTAAK